MTHPTDGIQLKLERASEHLKVLHQEVSAFLDGEAHGIITDFHSEPGCMLLKARVSQSPPPHFAVLIGETLYHLRACLDYLACELTKLNHCPVTTKVEFPIFDKREAFRKGRAIRIGGMTPRYQAVIQREQPFRRSEGSPHDDSLWLLHALAKADRHQFLHLTVSAVDVAIVQFRPKAAVARFVLLDRHFGPLTGDTTVARFGVLRGPRLDVEVDAQLRFDVVFSRDGPAAGRPVLRTLSDMVIRVAELLRQFGPYDRAPWQSVPLADT